MIINFNELKSESVIFYQLMNEVMLDLNMFSLRMLYRILRDINGIGIVTVYGEMFLTNTIIKKKFLHPKEFECSNYLQQCIQPQWWKKYGILFLTCP